MVAPEPYIPDVIKGIAQRVIDYFAALPAPITVSYDHGLHEQVGWERLRKTGPDADVLIWLVMPFDEDEGKPEMYCTIPEFTVLFATKTTKDITQVQREQTTFFPKLMPVFKKFKEEVAAERHFSNPYPLKVRNRKIPYWGGTDDMNTGQPNLWKENVDAIRAVFRDTDVERSVCQITHS